MSELEIIDAEPVLDPLPPMEPTETECMARSKRARKYCLKHGYLKKPFTRCDKHGGKTPSGPASVHYKNGKRSKGQYLPEHLTARMENLNADAIQNLEESINIQQALETKILEQLKTGESSEIWSQLGQIVTSTRFGIGNLRNKPIFPGEGKPSEEEIEDQERTLKAEAFDVMANCVIEGKMRYSVQVELRKQVQSIHDSQRKLTETLTKSKKEIQETFTHQEWADMLGTLMQIIKMRVTPDVLILIARDIEARQPKQLEA